MKNIYLFLLVSLFFAANSNAQSIEELKSKKDALAAEAAAKQAEVDALNGQIGGLQADIEKLSGWMKGLAGNIGFDFNKSNSWVAAPNPNASSVGLGVGLTAFANKMSDKTMWRNKGIINKAWQDINLSGDSGADDKGLFDSGTVDILNLSSLYGYRIHPKIAISSLAELNTSIENFLKPGAFDIGVGATWTPSNNLVVVVHPFNYHLAWSADGDASSVGALGAKIRADYTKSYVVLGKTIGASSTFTLFQPYSNTKTAITNGGQTWEAGLFEYTWLNSLSFELWRGIGVGVGFGFRGSDFEINDQIQSFYNLGLSYGF